jgi:hypothetical protein
MAGLNLEPVYQWSGKRVWSSEGTIAILILVILYLYSNVLMYKSAVQNQVLHYKQCLDNKETGRKVMCGNHIEKLVISTWNQFS